MKGTQCRRIDRRLRFYAALLCVFWMLTGCRSEEPPLPVREGPLPANTVLMSSMMQELSAQPGFTEAMLEHLQHGTKTGAAILTPVLVDKMRAMIVGKDWKGLDRFPGMTMREIDPAVHVVGHEAGKAMPATVQEMRTYVDYGPYPLDKPAQEDMDTPSTRPGYTSAGIVSELGAGVTRGDGPNQRLAPEHAESQRLAEVMNRLALNGVKGVSAMVATMQIAPGSLAPGESRLNVTPSGKRVMVTPEDLVQGLIDGGHTVVVSDARYFANFGHLHYKGQEVMVPFWLNAQVTVPGAGRALLVPVSHAEYEWQVRGPKVNADVAFYFGIDGKAHFRTMDELDQAWVLGRHAHEYKGEDAIEVTRLVGRMVIAYAHQHTARPALPFGGYYALGVCQDGVSAIEKKMTGAVTLFPNTADTRLFDNPEDAEINQLLADIPKDRAGAKPEMERVFGSLPTEDLKAITIPGLAEDLSAVQAAWQNGSLERSANLKRYVVWGLFGLMGIGVLYGLFVVVRDQMAPREDM